MSAAGIPWSAKAGPPVVRPLPPLLTLPLGLLPSRVHSTALAAALNRLWAAETASGDLDFLRERVLALRVVDLRLEARITLCGGRFRDVAGSGPADLTIAGNAYEFLLLASREEDPDTLFFQRRLRLEGNADLGLHVKNFLDAVDLDSGRLPLPLRQLLRHAAPLYARLFTR